MSRVIDSIVSALEAMAYAEASVVAPERDPPAEGQDAKADDPTPVQKGDADITRLPQGK